MHKTVPDLNKCATCVLNFPFLVFVFFLYFLLFTDDFPKPQITVQPETQSALKGTNVTFICSAASSSDSPMTFAWKKDNEVLNDAEIHNQAHLRVQAGAGGETEVTEYTTTLQLRNVEFSSEGKYQCVISNHFGSSYSTKARLTVNSKLATSRRGITLALPGSKIAQNSALKCSTSSQRFWLLLISHKLQNQQTSF